MEYKIEFSQKAFQDLEAIKNYIYDRNETASREVVKYIIDKIETFLAPNPCCGRAGRVAGTRELVLTKYPYIIPYLVKKDVIYIVRVLHTSRKWQNNLE